MRSYYFFASSQVIDIFEYYFDPFKILYLNRNKPTRIARFTRYDSIGRPSTTIARVEHAHTQTYALTAIIFVPNFFDIFSFFVTEITPIGIFPSKTK